MLLVLSIAMVPHRGVAASGADQPYQITSFAQRDTNGDGKPDEAEVHCRCYSANDRIVVVDTAGDMQPASDLAQGTDMANDLWLFDVGNRGFYQLAVQFHHAGSQLSADIYEDENGDGKVAVAPKNGHLAVTEPGFPAIHVVAVDGYWQRDGRIAPDFDLTVDGRMMATFGGELYESRMKNDGRPDVRIQVRGPHGADPRSYDWRNVETPIPASSAVRRSTLTVRERGQEPAFAPVFPWYLLGATYGAVKGYQGGKLPTVPLSGTENRPYGMVKPYGQSFPPIQVDWNTGKLAYVGELVASRGSDVNWFTYSDTTIRPDRLSNPDFESPFAFYNISGSHPGTPDLEVRVERATPNDPFAAPTWDGRIYQQIRYSWEQQAGQGWSFKLGLLGQHPISTVVPFSDFSLQTVPYSQLPAWVTGNDWDIATFVAVERPQYSSTEGIYEWDPTGSVRDEYYAGVTTDPGTPFGAIAAGLRGEYSLHLGTQPWLYFSPVDGRLHLVGAEGGIYQVDKTHKVNELNLDDGPDIDGWQLIDGDQISAQLYQLGGRLLYGDGHQVSLLTTPGPEETFRTLPPTDHASWSKLDQHLKANQRPFAADDLGAMFNQFQGQGQSHGQRLTISGAAIQNLHAISGGYRFVLNLQPGYNLGGFPISGVSKPGSYAVTLTTETGTFSATPLTPAKVEIDSLATPISSQSLSPINLAVSVRNLGTTDLSAVPVVLTAQRPGKAIQAISQKTVDLLGGASATFSSSWSPPSSGRWTIQAHVYLPDGTTIGRSAPLQAVAPPEPSWRTLVPAAWPRTSPYAYLLALIGLAGLAAAGSLMLLRGAR